MLCTLLFCLATPWSLGFSRNTGFTPYPTTVLRSLSRSPKLSLLLISSPPLSKWHCLQVAQVNTSGVILPSALKAKGQACFSEQSQLDVSLGLWILSGWHKVRKSVELTHLGQTVSRVCPLVPVPGFPELPLFLLFTLTSSPTLSLMDPVSFLELSIFNIFVLFSMKEFCNRTTRKGRVLVCIMKTQIVHKTNPLIHGTSSHQVHII